MTTEWDEILNGASEAEIVELAAILGFTGLVNQVQYHAAQKTDQPCPINFGGWNAAAKAEQLKFVPMEPDNKTDVEESIRRLEDDDPTLTSLNLNNIKVNLSFKNNKKMFLSFKM